MDAKADRIAARPSHELDGASAEIRFQADVRRHLARNYLAHLVHGLLGQTGFRLVQAPTFVPAYVYLLSGSDLVVGLARAGQSLGQFLSPVLGATAIEHRTRVLPIGLLVGAAMRLQLLGLALAGFFLPPRWGLVAFCGFLALFGFFLGMQGVVFNFLVSKVIPVERRGALVGLRGALAGVTAAAVGLAGGVLVEREAWGNGYAATFGVGFVLTSLGLASLLFMREPASPRVRTPGRIPDRLRELPALLRSDRPFTFYFVARALGMMGRMSVPFYVIYAATRIELSGRDLGLLTAAFVLALSMSTLMWGIVADRRGGFRGVFLASLVVWIFAALLLLATQSFGALLGVFVGLGAGQGGFMMSSQNLVLEFGARENLPMRIAVANSTTELVGALGPLLGGVLATVSSYEAVFWAAIGFQGVALVLGARFVPEPRRRARGGEPRPS